MVSMSDVADSAQAVLDSLVLLKDEPDTIRRRIKGIRSAMAKLNGELSEEFRISQTLTDIFHHILDRLDDALHAPPNDDLRNLLVIIKEMQDFCSALRAALSSKIIDVQGDPS